MISNSHNVRTALEILKDEVDGDVKSARSKMSSEYSQTWMYQTKEGELFPSDVSGEEESMEETYHIKGREYHIYTITESENTVMIECVEQYPDEETGQLYRTPEVLIIEFKDGKINKGRHYCDPRLSYLTLTDEILSKAYKNALPIFVIK